MDFYEKLRQERIVPVVKINDAAKAPELARALLAGGLSVIELTFRSAAAADAIRAVCREVPELAVCAGTVLTPEQAAEAVEAGAQAIVSPGTNEEVVRWCLHRGVPVIPGVATPTEAEACIRMGLDTLKLFPAETVGGVGMLKALAGPYSYLRFMPTGGINLKNLPSYLALPNVLCCGGSWIAPEKLIDAGGFAAITALAREAALLTRPAQWRGSWCTRSASSQEA